MKILTTGRQIGSAVKNVPRVRQIVAVFSRYGFSDFIERTGFGRYLPGMLTRHTKALENLTTPERLRLAFEELGPTFIKLGQLLSTRADLLPESFIQEFTKLQDNVPSLPFEAISTVIREELKHDPNEIFASLNKTPLAAASIAQVHEATLKTGEKVVLKVQRPEIKKIIEQDIAILTGAARLLERYVPETRILSPQIFAEEFFRTLAQELDFRVEANNMAKIAENFKKIDDIVIPKIFREFSGERVLVQEKFEGVRVTDAAAMDAAGIDRKQVVRVGAKAFFQSVMIHRLFHADLHAGNLFVLPGNKLGIIDFGIVGRLSERARDQLATMLTALLTEDFETLCYTYAELGGSDTSVDFDAFQRELRNTISPYMGLAISEVNSGRLMMEATRVAGKFNIRIPGEWMQVFKALITTEGMGRTLDPQFDMLELGRDMIRDLVKEQYSLGRLARETSWIGREMVTLARVLPRQLRWMFRKFNRDDFAFEFKSADVRDLGKQLDHVGKRTALSVMGAGSLITAAIAMQTSSAVGETQVLGYPLSAAVAFTLGLLILLRVMWR